MKLISLVVTVLLSLSAVAASNQTKSSKPIKTHDKQDNLGWNFYWDEEKEIKKEIDLKLDFDKNARVCSFICCSYLKTEKPTFYSWQNNQKWDMFITYSKKIDYTITTQTALLELRGLFRCRFFNRLVGLMFPFTFSLHAASFQFIKIRHLCTSSCFQLLLYPSYWLHVSHRSCDYV